MSKAVQVIEEEIKTFDEMLKSHSYHLYALRELRKRLIAEEAEFVKPPKPVVVNTLASKAKGSDRIPQSFVNKMARRVGVLVRKGEAKSKAGALRILQSKGLVTDQERSRVEARMVPSYMGKQLHDKLFKGTKYVK